jgi:hypothetical protein
MVTKEDEMIDDRKVLRAMAAGSVLALGLVLVLLFMREASLVRASTTSDLRYVKTDGVDAGNDCTLIASPCRTVQHALDSANPDDEILVATGVYTGVQARNSMTQVVYISQTVTLRGGYSDDFASWDPTTYPTTLDAERKGRVVSIVGAGNGATLDSFTITGGDATGVTAECPSSGGITDGCGGGIFVRSAHPTIVNNMVTDNVAAFSASNHSASGGGLCLAYAYGTVITNNVVISNTASTGERGMGGGIHMYFPNNVSFASNQVLSNTATTHNSFSGWGGGLAIGSGSSPATIHGNRIEGNRTNGSGTGQGAGIYLWFASANLADNLVVGNVGSEAVFLGHSQFGFESNRVVDNDTTAGVLLSHNPTPSDLKLINNIVARSGSKSFGVIGGSVSPLTVTLLHNTLVGSGTGYGVHVDTGYMTLNLTNNIVAHHAWGITNTVPASSSVVADHTLFWANAEDGIGGTNPVVGNPAFVDPEGGDYHLSIGSAARNAGIDAGVLTDIDGDARPTGLAPDIGADEASWRQVFLPVVLRQD